MQNLGRYVKVRSYFSALCTKFRDILRQCIATRTVVVPNAVPWLSTIYIMCHSEDIRR